MSEMFTLRQNLPTHASLRAAKPRGNPSAFFFNSLTNLSFSSLATGEVRRKMDCHAPKGARDDACGVE
jgi:hypothetical protein